MLSENRLDRLRARGFTVIPDRPALPPPGDAWRFVHQRAHTAETSVPRGNQRLLWARWSAALAQVGATNIGHVHLAVQGFSEWITVKRPADDVLFRQLQDHGKACVIVNFPPSVALLAFVTHEHCHEISWFDSSSATPYVPATLLDSIFFVWSESHQSSSRLTYIPLTLTRVIRRDHRHVDIGNFEFDIVKHIVDHGLYAEIAGRCPAEPKIDRFANAPAAATYHQLDTLVENHDHVAFLFFAAHALREHFVAPIDIPWLWRFPASKQALLQLRQMTRPP